MRKKIYLATIAVAYAALAVVFDTLPRSTFSPLEKRELATFPQFSWQSLASGEFAQAVSHWFSDTEPYRDRFMQGSMTLKDLAGLAVGSDEEQVVFHASADKPAPKQAEDAIDDRQPGEYTNRLNANEKAKIANRGILIVGKGDKVRALMAYGGEAGGASCFANLANAYKKAFPKCQVYCMPIPTAIEYYCPDRARSSTRPQLPTIKNIFAHLDKDVHAVDIYTTLGRHAAEDIYFRTDHHWAPLGAYYAAEQVARVARVPFKPLSAYERKVVHGYVGSMYGYSKDISVKNAPEDFVYYKPTGVTYETTFVTYSIDKDYNVTREGKPCKGSFFYEHYRDGSGATYGTFMGGDTQLTCVRTSVHNGRRLLIIKDSFGNALPSNLFYSFEEIDVVDFRYFAKNMRRYVQEHKITDILLALNIFNAYNPTFCGKVQAFIDQPDGVRPPAAKKEESARPDKAAKADKSRAKTAARTKAAGHEETAAPAEAPAPQAAHDNP